jgi:glycosyltransferase involved in cell wall biosynthesis
MSVCFIAGTLGRGGAERQLCYIIRALKTLSVETRVLCLTQGEPLQAEIEALGIQVAWVGGNESRAARIREITRVLRADPPDIIQSTHFYTNIYAALAAVALGRRGVGAVRNDVELELAANGRLGKIQLLLPRYLVANSRLGWRRAIEGGRSAAKTFLLQNAVDLDKFSPADAGHPDRRRQGEDGDATLRLLFVGRMVPQKRVDMFLRLVRDLDSQPRELIVQARLVGAGRDGQAMRELAANMGLDGERVRFEDETADMTTHYRWADMLVLTSRHEGTPNVILEAMGMGLPVVATAVGGVPDLLAHGGGLLVRPDDEAGLLDAVLRLHDDPGLRDVLARDGLRYVRANHSLDGLAMRLRDLYRQICGE